MAWIESHQSLSRHRKTLKTAGRLSVDRHKLIGHLPELWWWGVDNVGVDGRMDDLTSYEIGYAAQWDGDHDEFVEALIYGGFLRKDGSCYILHVWYDYAGKLIERRDQERERSRRRREESKADDEKDEISDPQTTNGRPVVDQRSTVGTVQYSTVPNSTVPDMYIMSENEEKFIELLGSIKNYPLERERDLEMYQTLQERYPKLDLIEALRDWKAYKLDKPLTKKSNARAQLNNAFRKYLEWGRCLKARDSPKSRDDDWKYGEFLDN